MSARPGHITTLAWATLGVLTMGFVAPGVAYGADASVIVEQTTTTTTVPFTAPTTTMVPITSPPTTSQPTTTVPEIPVTAPPPADQRLVNQPDPQVPDNSQGIIPALVENVRGAVSSIASAAKVTSRITNSVLSGMPVAQALQEALPEAAAAIVVPAVRTASKFSFPIGLGAAVMIFLTLQQRIDSNDPKLAAAPMAHDDEVVNFA